MKFFRHLQNKGFFQLNKIRKRKISQQNNSVAATIRIQT